MRKIDSKTLENYENESSEDFSSDGEFTANIQDIPELDRSYTVNSRLLKKSLSLISGNADDAKNN